MPLQLWKLFPPRIIYMPQQWLPSLKLRMKAKPKDYCIILNSFSLAPI
jgi:hypothetical protein